MNKNFITLVLLAAFTLTLSVSCKKEKEKEKEPDCSWFPVITGKSYAYSFSQHLGNTEPFPVDDKLYPATDSSLSIYKLLFVVRDCSSNKLLFDHGPSDERIVLFDKSQTGKDILITDVVFHGIRHFVTQTSSGDGKLTSVVKEEPSAHEELIATLLPGTGIVYVAAINPTTGEIIYTVNLK